MTLVWVLSTILSFFKYNISETGSVSIISCKGGKFRTQLGLKERVALNHSNWHCINGPLHLVTERHYSLWNGMLKTQKTTENIQNNSHVCYNKPSSETFRLVGWCGWYSISMYLAIILTNTAVKTITSPILLRKFPHSYL
jgi:hypothetical protein